MAHQDAFDPLRVVTQRLSSTPAKQLPHVAPYLATSIAQSGKSFGAQNKEGQAVGVSESAIAVHKLKTQLSALLQDRTPEARYAAVILIKATVEAGGWDVLQGLGAWVRGLIGILGKSDFTSTKKLCILTLTRIFLLTHEHQSLVREITTPSLPGFITACLNLTQYSGPTKTAQGSHVQSPLLDVVLHALNELIVKHPTSFRPFAPQIQSLTYPLIAPIPSNIETGNDPIPISASVSESARCLFVSLHVCGPKNTAGEGWAKSLDTVLISVQRTADKVFRSLIEGWTSSRGNRDGASSNMAEEVVSDQHPTPLPLPTWTGIHAGIERLEGLLYTLQACLASATAATVTLPIGSILDIINRVLAILPPGNGKNPRIKPEIGRNEREGLWIGLPRLQISAIGVCSLMISRMGNSSAAIASAVMEQLLWTLESQHGNYDFRRAAYVLVSQILSGFGPSLAKTNAVPLSRCIRMCCEDLLPSVEPQMQGGQASFPDNKKSPNGIRSSTNADSYLKSSISQVDLSGAFTNVIQAARELLPLTLMNLPNEYLPFSLRCQIDRTAIITKNKKAMLASVMNPTSKCQGRKQISSILPLLARAYPEALEVEALLRPRMPPIQSRRSYGRGMESDEEQDTYMHDHPQSGESDGFYHDLVGTNGNARVEKNTVPVEHSNVQVDVIIGAREEGASNTNNTKVSTGTAAGLPESRSAFSHTSTKRNREEDSDSGTQNSLEGNSAEQIEIGLASKRSRVEIDETRKETPLESAPADPAVVESSGPGQAIQGASASSSAAMSDRQHILQQEGSDESDFEMPILNLDPDTDEEEDEKEDDGLPAIQAQGDL